MIDINALLNSVDAMFDLEIHNPRNHESALSCDKARIYRKIYEELKSRILPEESNIHVHHGHLLAGYDAGYYAYIWYVDLPVVDGFAEC